MLRWLYTFSAMIAAVSLLPARVAAEYRVGQGDLLQIEVFQEKELSREIEVTSEGFISFPPLGKVKVGDLTPTEIADLLTERLAREYLTNPQLIVSVKEYVSRTVHVLGSVRKPGAYVLKGDATLTDLLSMAGGDTEQAGKSIILVRAASSDGEPAVPVRISLASLLEKGDKSLDLPVFGGDRIYLPKAEEVYVIGEVEKAGSVTYHDGMTLLEAISKVGGYKATAAPNRIQIKRIVDGKEQMIRVDGKMVQEGKTADVPLLPGDLINVPRAIF